ncbi:DUF2339 domain-containing protein [Pseudomonas sp. 21LCFQ010]|uniref:DUF2339 domain-containing protein n=1 Tax=Pseudomonas sp. 21LCFQ010 TaxID=2957506 RepID=UPI0020979985|nr:DUF2339 domain-containing protein [Pseudomonas sp. 21LCFQ010]
MPWFVLVFGAAALGYFLSYPDSEAGTAFGALLGWLVWQGLRLRELGRQTDAQAQQLNTVQKDLQTLQQRLEQTAPAGLSGQAAAASVPSPPPQAELHPEPELVWELPPMAAQTTPQADAWQPGQHAPNLFERALGAARDWLLGGNTVLRVGVVLLFLGLAFLLRYATEGMVVPIEARYAGVAASALALLGLGWWLRGRNPGFALMLQGTGVAVLYLTVFAAMKLHPLLDPTLGFALLVIIMACSAILAVAQDSLALACAATLGGFAAPLLASTGQGSHVALFSYFALLNTGIFAIAWFKAWRLLNLIGFVGTFGIGFAWGLNTYTPALFWSTEPFLVLFFFMYLAIGLLFARRKLLQAPQPTAHDSPAAQLRWAARQSDYVDGSLLFGTPLVGFGLQYAIVEHLQFGAAFSALVLGLVYMGIARLLASRATGQTRLLLEACLALGVVFATLAIPLGLDAQWTTAAWAIEGAAVFWLGLRQQRLLARGFGLLLQLAAGLVFSAQLNDSYLLQAAASLDFWTPMLLALAGLSSAWCAWHLRTALRIDPLTLGIVLLVWSGAWWACSLGTAVLRFAPQAWQLTWLLLAAAVSVLLWTLVSARLRWPGLALLCCALMPVSALLLLGALANDYHPAAHGGWFAWLAVIAVHLLSLRRLAEQLPGWVQDGAHALGCWVILGVLAMELRYLLLQLAEQLNAWRWLGWALLPSLYLWAMAAQRNWPWPVAERPRAYRQWATAPLAALMLLWFWLANALSDGSAAPLPYMPLLNPLEIGLLLACGGIVLWLHRHLPAFGIAPARASQLAALVAGSSLFALLTAMVMRTGHHWSDVAWDSAALLDSMRVQAGLSIVWTLMALALMIGGHLKARREVWLAGAALIGLVVIKLFFVELSDRGSLERIVSFIGVGILLLVVGYFAPLPPKSPVIKIGDEPGHPPLQDPAKP